MWLFDTQDAGGAPVWYAFLDSKDLTLRQCTDREWPGTAGALGAPRAAGAAWPAVALLARTLAAAPRAPAPPTPSASPLPSARRPARPLPLGRLQGAAGLRQVHLLCLSQ